MKKGSVSVVILLIIALVFGISMIASNLQHGEIEVSAVTGGVYSCQDSDNGINIYLKGTCTSPIGSSSDFCLSASKLREYYCFYGYCRYTTSYCPSGYKCVNGACALAGTNTTTTTTTTTTIRPTTTITCTKNSPKISVTPNSYSGVPGSTFNSIVNITNKDSLGCGSSNFYLRVFAQSARGTANASTPVIYSIPATPKPVYYYIYSDLGSAGSWAKIIIKDETGNVVETKTINQGDSWDFSSLSGLTIWVTKVRALQDGTVIGTDLFAFNSSWKTALSYGDATNLGNSILLTIPPGSPISVNAEITSSSSQATGSYKIDFVAHHSGDTDVGVASAVYNVSKYACVWTCVDRGYTTGICKSSCLSYEKDAGVDGCISGQKCCCMYFR